MLWNELELELALELVLVLAFWSFKLFVKNYLAFHGSSALEDETGRSVPYGRAFIHQPRRTRRLARNRVYVACPIAKEKK
jgi:hypothetical protein